MKGHILGPLLHLEETAAQYIEDHRHESWDDHRQLAGMIEGLAQVLRAIYTEAHPDWTALLAKKEDANEPGVESPCGHLR